MHYMGSDLMCFINKKSIALATNHTLEISAETISCSTKDNGGGEWETSEAGLLSYTISTENLIGDERNGAGYDDLFDILIKKQPIDIIFGLKSTIADRGTFYEVSEGGWDPKANSGYSGRVILTSLSLNAPNGDHATMSATFTGTGALKKLNADTVLMAAKPEAAKK